MLRADIQLRLGTLDLAVALQAEAGEVYNVGASEEHENVELTRLIVDHLGADPALVRNVEDRAGHDRRYSLDEAYADYNLAFTRFQLGNCDGVLELLDSSESIQGQRAEIDRLRQQAQENC